MRAIWLALILAASGDPGASSDAPGASVRTWRAEEVVREIGRTGRLAGGVIDEDIDLSRLVPSAGIGRITFSQVNLRGRLFGTPHYPLLIEHSSVCTLGPAAEGLAWLHDVQLHWVAIARVQLDRAHLAGQISCIGCIICRADLAGSQLDGDASFVEATRFGVREAADACVRKRPVTCSPADFTDATFRSTARFDGAEFAEGARFEGAEFQASARFPRVTSAQPVRFVGARLRGDADFRDCRLTGAEFGLDRSAAYESSSFAARADFRDCTFSGPVRFDNAEFRGDTVFARARVDSDIVSFRGVLASRPLDLREMTVEGRTSLLVDAIGADALRMTWSALGPAVLRGAQEMPSKRRVAMLQTLAARLAADGSPRAARAVAFESERWRRPERCIERWGSCFAGHAEWWLWTLPTRNGTDPTLIVLALVALWGAVVLAAARPASLVLLRRASRDSSNPVYAPYTPGRADVPLVGVARVLEAMRFATRLVLKVGKTRARWLAPAPRTRATVDAAVLRIVWWGGWALMAAVTAVLATSFPGLAFLRLGG